MLPLILITTFLALIGQGYAVLPTCTQLTTVELSTILPAATVDYNSLTVSGFSSGAAMAVQYHFAYSSEVKGAGVFAAVPYGAFKNNSLVGARLLFFPVALVESGTALPLPISESNSELEEQADWFASQGLIDPLSNLGGSKVYVFNGQVDPLVNNEYGHRTADMYSHYGASVISNLAMQATHTVPTDNFPTFLQDCPLIDLLADYINNCNYQGISKMFSHLYGGNYIQPPSSTTPAAGNFYRFNQIPYTGEESTYFMDPTGYIYIPTYCTNPSNTCKIHIALHGCTQSFYGATYCNFFALNTGYIQEADANHVIVVFPQASRLGVTTVNATTNYSCWDFVGGTSTNFCFKTAPQIVSIRKISRVVAGLTI